MSDLFSSNERGMIVNDLFQAYYDARKNKRSSINALAFEKHLEANLFGLADEIIERRYLPKPSICFIVNRPVKREIFAADFRDRIIHHFIYNYISPVFEKKFINDSYSCRIGRGTHFGIQRVNYFIRSCSNNYRRDCYILKLDIKGYFMAMNKDLLYDMIENELMKYDNKSVFDLKLVLYLVMKTIYNDPTKECIIKGLQKDWVGLPKTKSLFHTSDQCGLPIGNLTSQLFGNIYLNDFDHWIKRQFNIRYYGRYVDDFVIVHTDAAFLANLIPQIATYLLSYLKLTLHPDKIYFQHYSKGVKYLGVVIKPYRLYISNRTKGNFFAKVIQHSQVVRDHKPDRYEQYAFMSSMNSYFGILKHYRTYKIRRSIIRKYLSSWWRNYFRIDSWSKVVNKSRITSVQNKF